MSNHAKEVSKLYCDYEIKKAKLPSRIYTVKSISPKPNGIVTSGLSKAMLTRQLAALF